MTGNIWIATVSLCLICCRYCICLCKEQSWLKLSSLRLLLSLLQMVVFVLNKQCCPDGAEHTELEQLADLLEFAVCHCVADTGSVW